MADEVPLPTLLSHALVAFTIEVDNEFERQLPHRTSTGPAAKSGRGPWLVSLAMWSGLLRHVPPDGITVAALRTAVGTAKPPLAGMTRWGYISVDGDRVTSTRAGRKACTVWENVVPAVEGRWRDRHGAAAIDALTGALDAVAGRFDVELPGYLPMSSYGLFATVGPPRANERRGGDLNTLLNQVLLAFTLDYERNAALSLAVSADVLRLLDADEDMPIRDLPRRAGVSKEALDVSLGLLHRDGGLVTATTRQTRLTSSGAEARTAYLRRLAATEDDWNARYATSPLRRALADVPAAMPEPYPDSWRAARRQGPTLPDHPMVSHRGGFPDGA